MKILIVPDTHGSHNWEIVKTIPKENYDKIIFMGDYFDSWDNQWPDQGENFKNECDFVREDILNRKMVFGNHCWSYISGSRDGGAVSGHQISKIGEIRALLNANYDILDIAEEYDGWIFSHAGFSKTWVDGYFKPLLHQELDKWPEEDENGKGVVWDESEYSIQFINDFFHKHSHWPGAPDFSIGLDELLDWHGYFSGSGNERTQGPFWIRPESLLMDAYYPNQVVGHTEYGVYGPLGLENKGNKVLVVDSPTHSNIFIFDTENPGDFITVDKFNKTFKVISKVLNDGRSQHKTRDQIEFDLIEQTILNSEKAKIFLNNVWEEEK